MRHEAFRAVARQSGRDPSPRLHDEMRQFLQQFVQGDADASSVVTSEWTPRVDIREERSRFVILADLPGIDPAQVEIWMDKGVLSLKGERAPAIQDAADGEANEVRFSRVERNTGRFHRRFTLPDSADADAITASGHHGVLEISIPKRAESTPRRIQVGTAPKAGTRQ
ncbi:Hsp20/alpha crystallin family protein [Luteimonas sp. XNQY3]|nr:Hsp20/alpha crystallin family protein [Luteimonas sp. XNQY3]MCD9005837.1 Hsp20/alpha crystallin family protein [Luteimonas sp. XNQY3]